MSTAVDGIEHDLRAVAVSKRELGNMRTDLRLRHHSAPVDDRPRLNRRGESGVAIEQRRCPKRVRRFRERHLVVSRRMEGNERDGDSRRAAAVSEAAGDDGDRGDSERRIARHTVRHAAAIGESGDIHAAAIHWQVRRDPIDDAKEEGDVVDPFARGRATARPRVPVRAEEAESALGAVRIRDEKASRIRDGIHLRRMADRFAIGAAAVDHEDERIRPDHSKEIAPLARRYVKQKEARAPAGFHLMGRRPRDPLAALSSPRRAKGSDTGRRKKRRQAHEDRSGGVGGPETVKFIHAVRLKRPIIVLLVGAGALVAITASARLGLFAAHDSARLLDFVRFVRSTPYARIVFVVVYGIAGAVAVPVTPLTLAGGALFGPAEGIALNWLADMLAASLAFGVTRVLRPVRQEPDEQHVAARGFLGLLRLRVIPVVPFAVLNYGSAIYGMKWPSYLLATALGLIPTTVVYTVFAASLAAGVEGAGRRALAVASISAIGIIGLSIIPTLLRRRHARLTAVAVAPHADEERPATKRH